MHSEAVESPSSLEDLRLAIFRQHTQLEQLLDEVEGCASAVMTDRAAASRLRDAVRILHARFLRHLAFEEERLLPWLRSNGRSDEVLERTMQEEHAEQRRRAEGLLHDASVFDDAQSFAREALTFVHAIRRDMAAEDARLRAI